MGQHSKSRTRTRRTASAVVAACIAVGGALGTAQAAPPVPVEGTPCTAAARACVDLATRTAWLLADGTIVRGPVRVSIGGPGQETPRGDFRVEWKNIDHRSAEFDGAPMPFAVFFAQGGIAFHEGDLHTRSAGCVRLERPQAEAFYRFLQVDDRVQVR
jgi:hypothetical protein